MIEKMIVDLLIIMSDQIAVDSKNGWRPVKDRRNRRHRQQDPSVTEPVNDNVEAQSNDAHSSQKEQAETEQTRRLPPREPLSEEFLEKLKKASAQCLQELCIPKGRLQDRITEAQYVLGTSGFPNTHLRLGFNVVHDLCDEEFMKEYDAQERRREQDRERKGRRAKKSEMIRPGMRRVEDEFEVDGEKFNRQRFYSKPNFRRAVADYYEKQNLSASYKYREGRDGTRFYTLYLYW